MATILELALVCCFCVLLVLVEAQAYDSYKACNLRATQMDFSAAKNHSTNFRLKCDSNDKNHIFHYWYFQEGNSIIGPGYKFNSIKYRLQILSGTLTIKNLDPKDAGSYFCVSRGVTKNTFSICPAKLIIKKADATVRNSTFTLITDSITSNFLVWFLLLSSLLVLLIILILTLWLKCWKRKKEQPNLATVEKGDFEAENLMELPNYNEETDLKKERLILIYRLIYC